MQKFINISIDTTIESTQVIQKAIFKGDTLTMQIKVFDNCVLADLSNQIVDLILLKADGNPIEGIQKNVSNGMITATLTQQATLCEGIVRGTLQITESSTSHISTNEFTYLVLPSIADTVLEASKAEIETLQELLLIIANNTNTINQYKSIIAQVAGTTDAVTALATIESYVNTNLPALQSANSQAITNINNLHTENTQATQNVTDLHTENTNAQSKLDQFRLYDTNNLVTQVQRNVADINMVTKIDLPTQNTLQKYAKDMNEGKSVVIETWGDSLYWGHASGIDPVGTQVAEPAPMTLQKVLQSWFNNTNISVVNQGAKGYSTSNVIANWDSSMQTSTANIIYINYCINDGKDGGVSQEQYRANLRTMIRTARQRNKTVILETPNPVLEFDSANDGMGSPTRAENIKHYVQIMRDVAKELNVILIDNYIACELYLERYPNIATTMPDGMHPSDDLYKFKAVQMASIFLAPNDIRVKNDTVIPCTSSLIKSYGYPNVFSPTPLSKVGVGVFAQNIKIAFWVGEPNLDIYIASSLWKNGSNACNVIIDSKLVKTLNAQYDGFGSGVAYPIDLEFKVMEKASRGFHIIELNNIDTTNTTRQMGLYYLSAKKNYYVNKINHIVTGTQPLSYSAKTVLENLEITAYGGESHVLTDVVTSNWLSTLDVEVTATLLKSQGICLFATNRSDGLPRGGIRLYLDATNGCPKMSQGLGTAYGSATAFNSTDYSNAQHKYRFKADISGNVNVYIDGTQIGTFTMDAKFYGGYFGVWTNIAGAVKIDKVVFYN